MKTQPTRTSLAPLILACAVAVAVTTTSARAQIPSEYEVTAIIAGFQCGDHLAAVTPWALNEAGDVAGGVTCGLVQRAFRWTAESGLELIPTPPQTSRSRALAINGSKVVGWYDNEQLELGTTGFIYDFETDQFTSLGTLPGGDWSEAHGINSKGAIVGFWQNSQVGPRHGFIFENGIMQSLGDDLGTPNSQANDINNDSKVTGWMGSSPQIDVRAFIWDDGKVTELPPIPGGFTSEGWTINNLQDVAGRGRFFDPDLNATVWRAFAFIDGEAINLGTLPGIEKSFATGINDDKTVVGFAQIPPLRAFVWKDGKMTALNDLIPPGLGLDFNSAHGINQGGQIAAMAHSDDLNATVGLLLSPIQQGIPGDLDGDGQVDVSDFLILLASWGPCDHCENCPPDLDHDCVVGVSDFLILLANWG